MYGGKKMEKERDVRDTRRNMKGVKGGRMEGWLRRIAESCLSFRRQHKRNVENTSASVYERKKKKKKQASGKTDRQTGGKGGREERNGVTREGKREEGRKEIKKKRGVTDRREGPLPPARGRGSQGNRGSVDREDIICRELPGLALKSKMAATQRNLT